MPDLAMLPFAACLVQHGAAAGLRFAQHAALRAQQGAVSVAVASGHCPAVCIWSSVVSRLELRLRVLSCHSSLRRHSSCHKMLCALQCSGACCISKQQPAPFSRRFAELKSLNLNPANPQQLAVAASDPLLRIYDRRMLTPGTPVYCSSDALAVAPAGPHRC